MSVNPRAWLAEAIATFALVFFGPLSIILAIAILMREGQRLQAQMLQYLLPTMHVDLHSWY